MSKLEVVSMLDISNMSRIIFHLDINNCINKYNPEIHLGAVTGIGLDWSYDNKTYSSWPESFE